MWSTKSTTPDPSSARAHEEGGGGKEREHEPQSVCAVQCCAALRCAVVSLLLPSPSPSPSPSLCCPADVNGREERTRARHQHRHDVNAALPAWRKRLKGNNCKPIPRRPQSRHSLASHALSFSSLFLSLSHTHSSLARSFRLMYALQRQGPR